MAKLLTSWLVSRFLQHNLRLVVLGKCLLIMVMKFEDKFARLQQLLNSSNGQDKFQIWCINMYLIWFLANFAVFRMFLWILRVYLNFAAPWPRWISEALILWAASFTLYKLATIFLQLVTKGQPGDFFNFEPWLHYLEYPTLKLHWKLHALNKFSSKK